MDYQGDVHRCVSTKNKHSVRKTFFDVHYDCVTAYRLLERKSNREGLQVLVRGFDGIRVILEDEQPQVVDSLFYLIFYLTSLKNKTFLKAFLNRFAKTARSLLPENHPLSQISRRLREFDTAQLFDVVLNAWHSMIDLFKALLGPFHSDTLVCVIDYLLVKCNTGNGDESDRQLRALLRECEELCGLNDLRSMLLLNRLGELLLKTGRFADAEVAGRDIVQRSLETQSDEFRHGGLDILARSQYCQGKLQLAVSTQSELADLCCLLYGGSDSVTCGHLVRLEEWLMGLSRAEEAEECRERRRRLWTGAISD